MPEKRIYQLTALFFEGKITEEENAELARLVSSAKDDALLADLLLQAWGSYQPAPEIKTLADARLIGLPEKLFNTTPVTAAPIRSLPPRKTWLRIAAAFLVAVFGLLTWYIVSQKNITEINPVTVRPTDLPPGGTKATLTLANGELIFLDSSHNGNLASQGAVQIVKQDGVLTYRFDKNTSSHGNELAYNTVTTPRGGEYSVVLPDGSQVWLNAASSIRFPTAFTAHERRVEVSGELYMEVKSTPGSKIPFVVNILTAGGKKGEIKVLGTKFNVNAYPNESHASTTLLEGKVMISTANETPVYLSPGQQGRISPANQLSIHTDIDTEAVMAWRNGLFSFVNADIQDVMQQVSRWYDVDVVYAGKIPDERFEGTIPRNSTIQEVFRILELSNLHVKMEGRTVTVLP